MSWIPLHVHSQFSILDSTISVKKIASKAKELSMPAVALTDNGNMYGAVDFYKACKNKSLNPILGCEIALAPASRFEKKKMPGQPTGFPLVLLVKDEKGYRNLCKLSSLGFTEGFYYRPRIDKDILKQYSEGLICLSGGVRGKLGHLILNSTEEELQQEINWFSEVFGEDFYFELQRHCMSDENKQKDRLENETWVMQNYKDYIESEEKVVKKLWNLSKQKSIKCVATNDTHYLEREDWQGHEILLNVQSGEPCEIWERDSRGNPLHRVSNPKRKIYPSHEFYFKSAEMMQNLFADMPEAIENTNLVAEKCIFKLNFKTRYYPVYHPPGIDKDSLSSTERQKAAEEYLFKLCMQEIDNKYGPKQLEEVKKNYPNQEPKEVVKKRLENEFDIISSKGMCDYLLIVYDFISWAKKRNIPVGPGRGSAAGSILAFLLGITDIEPLRFHLFFERFINPERISYPDIDVDICMERRQEVIEYTIHKYGQDHVAQIITFGTMKAKMAIKDVGRVLSVPLVKVNAIAKLVPEDPNMTLDKALRIDPELKQVYETDKEAKRVIDIAKRIEGSIRNTSIHAAGLIICANPITDHIPVCTAKDSTMLVTQFAMKPVEAVGMLKIDFLGLKTLTSIQKAVEYVHHNTGKIIDWTRLPLDDKATFNLLNHGKTLGIFQLESGGMQDLAKQLHIDHFEEIIAVTALYRPGPMDMIPAFISRKHKREKIEMEHSEMGDILAETYGVMVYQEQVMQIASKLAGYSLGEGDVLRRAMGKKDKAEMERQREKFLQGAGQNGIDQDIAVSIFDKIEKFASYGFNKSHATAYAYLSYVTAYLKSNYPHEWMAALMTCDRDDLSKVAKFIQECRVMKIPILPPDVNEGGIEFVPTKDGIRFAMSGIKGVGEGVVEAILEEKKASGSYKSLYDFIKRVDTKRVGKKNIELLVGAGAFDFTSWTRDQLRESIEVMYDRASKDQKEKAKGVLNFFSLIENQESEFSHPPQVEQVSSKLQMLQKEKELLGFYLSAHPMESYSSLLKKLSCMPLSEIEKLPDQAPCRVAFVVDTVAFKITTKTQRKFALITISDDVQRYEIPIWPDFYEKSSHLLEENRLLYAVLQIERNDSGFRLQCRWLGDLTNVNQEMIKECDAVFDKVKSMPKKNLNKNGFANKQNVQKMQKQPDKSLLSIKLNADRVKLSHILKLKQIFRSNPGKCRILLAFISKGNKIANLHIDSSWGIQYEENIGKKIRNIDNVIDIIVK